MENGLVRMAVGAAVFLGAASSAEVRSALELAQEQGSVSLAERCRVDLASTRTPAERPPP